MNSRDVPEKSIRRVVLEHVDLLLNGSPPPLHVQRDVRISSLKKLHAVAWIAQVVISQNNTVKHLITESIVEVTVEAPPWPTPEEVVD